MPENTQSPFRPSPNPAPHKKTKVADKPVTPTTTTGTGTPSPAKDDPYAFQSPQPKMLFEEDASNELSLMTQRSHDDSEEEDIPDPELQNATHHNSFYFQSIFQYFPNKSFCFTNRGFPSWRCSLISRTF